LEGGEEKKKRIEQRGGEKGQEYLEGKRRMD
jgi:hypothetical protein